MTVHGVTIRNYRAIKRLHLPLHPQLTVLHGDNGSGKTTILTAIALALAPNLYGNLRRIESDLHGNLVPTISVGYGPRLESRVEGSLKGWGHTDSDQGSFVVGKAAGGEHAPIHMFYDTSRKVVSSLTERYVGTQANYDELFDWFYAKENEELRMQRERKDFEARNREISTVRDAICSMLRDGWSPHIDMRGDGPPRFSVTLDDEGTERQLSLEQLSGGYQSILAVAADVAWRIAKHEDWHAGRAGNRGAIALIDEVELHLHPAWQQRVLDDLTRTFPNVQFVVTTYSPQVLTTVAPEHIVELVREGDNVVAHETDAATYGAEAGELLTDVMGVDERPDNPFKRKLGEYRQLVRDGHGESQRGLALRRELDALSPRDPALVGADVEIRTRKRLQRMASGQ